MEEGRFVVVKQNELVKASFCLKAQEFRVIALMISMIHLTSYRLENILHLKSQYSFRIYEILKH